MKNGCPYYDEVNEEGTCGSKFYDPVTCTGAEGMCFPMVLSMALHKLLKKFGGKDDGNNPASVNRSHTVSDSAD